MKAATIKLHSDKDGKDPNGFTLMEATGTVYVNSGNQTVTGTQAVVDNKAQTITLTGNVVLSQGKNVITRRSADHRHGNRPGPGRADRPASASRALLAGGFKKKADDAGKPAGRRRTPQVTSTEGAGPLISGRAAEGTLAR